MGCGRAVGGRRCPGWTGDWDGPIQEGGELEQGSMALQASGAQGSYGTQAAPEMDTGQQGTGGEDET